MMKSLRVAEKLPRAFEKVVEMAQNIEWTAICSGQTIPVIATIASATLFLHTHRTLQDLALRTVIKEVRWAANTPL